MGLAAPGGVLAWRSTARQQRSRSANGVNQTMSVLASSFLFLVVRGVFFPGRACPGAGALRMFALSHGMSWHAWHAQDAATRASLVPQQKPVMLPSDASETSGEEEEEDDRADPWAGWVSGEEQRDAAKAAKAWPDGAPLGCGHGSPYLQPRWARAR